MNASPTEIAAMIAAADSSERESIVSTMANVEVSRANEGANCALHKACLRQASVATIG
jgi:hypothetical protein